MSVTQSPRHALTVADRGALRDALLRRRDALRAALRLYEGVPISAAARAPLARRTRSALVDVDAALSMLHRHGYGICEHCRQVLPLQSLVLRPLEMVCAECTPGHAPASPAR